MSDSVETVVPVEESFAQPSEVNAIYEGFLQVQAANKVDIRTGFKGSISTIYETFLEASDYIGHMVSSQCDGSEALKANAQIQTEQGSVHSFQFTANVKDYQQKMEDLAEKLEYVADVDFALEELYLEEDEEGDEDEDSSYLETPCSNEGCTNEGCPLT